MRGRREKNPETSMTKRQKKAYWKKSLKRDKYLIIMIVPVIIYYLVFCYFPMSGLYLEFLNGLYKEGLLEVEYNSLDRDQVIERISNDLTGVAFDFSWAMSMMYSNVLPYYDGTVETAFIGAAPLSGEYEGYYVGRVELGNMFGVNSSSSNIELACRFLDYAMSEPCQEMYQWGIEGESYTVDASGNKTLTEQASDNDWLQQLGINPSFVFPAQQAVDSTDVLVADWHAECNE